MTLDKPTKCAIRALDIVSSEEQIEDTQNDSGSIWINQGSQMSNTRISRIRECDFLRLVRVDTHDNDIVVLCDIMR
jgi:hypothetical protein